MARVTVEDCIVKIPNRFELVMVASQRAREIGSGALIQVDRDNDKNPVVALREIADTEISLSGLKESLVKNHQKVVEIEEDQEEVIDVMEGEAEWMTVAGDAMESEMAGAGMQEDDFGADEEDDAAEAGEDSVVADDLSATEEE